MDFMKGLIDKAKKINGSIVFAEGDEERTLRAALKVHESKLAKPILVAKDANLIKKMSERVNIDISNLTLVEPSASLILDEHKKAFISLLVSKGKTEKEAEELILDPLYFSSLYVKSNRANGCIAGARASTPDVIRSAIYVMGTEENVRLLSSFFLMIPPHGHPVIKEPVLYADCGVNPNPGSAGLKDIALSSVKSFRNLFPERRPKLAFLSFSTKGSAKHKMLDKIIEAVKLTKEHFKSSDVIIEGEVQFDTAVIPDIALKKMPGSKFTGDANIFIFPDLNSGNICYKVTERLAGFGAVGPVLQGLKKPVNDLSRGCSVDDIYFSSVITLLQSSK